MHLNKLKTSSSFADIDACDSFCNSIIMPVTIPLLFTRPVSDIRHLCFAWHLMRKVRISAACNNIFGIAICNFGCNITYHNTKNTFTVSSGQNPYHTLRVTPSVSLETFTGKIFSPHSTIFQLHEIKQINANRKETDSIILRVTLINTSQRVLVAAVSFEN